MTSTVARLTPAVTGALAWWVDELRGCLPQRLRERRRRQADAEIHLGHDGWTARLRTGRSIGLTAGDSFGLADAAAAIRGRRKDGRITIVVPLARCFVRRTDLPRRVLGRAAAILASELEVATPFNAGTTHWDWFVSGPGAAPGTVALQQVVLKRRDTEALASAVAQHGLSVISIAVEDPATRRRLPVDLTRHDGAVFEEASHLRGPRRLLVAAAIIAALAIVPAAFSRQAAILADLDGQIADATDAVALRPGLARASLQLFGEALTARRDFSAARALDGLAATLPADSHLDHVFLEKDVATIQGRTASLHNLERAFAASRLFTAGHNTAPPDSAAEGVPFTLRLKLRPAPRDSGT